MTRRTTLVCLLLAVLVGPAAAQEPRATVTGTVTGPDDAPLPGVQIADRNLQRGTTTGPKGRYTLSGLPPGEHTLEFRFVGYQTAVRTVTLAAGETTTLDVTLRSRVLESEGVTVTGTARAQSTLKAPQDVDVVDAAALSTNRSASLGATLADNVAGVSSVQTGAQAGKPVLRGLSGNRIVLLKDGIAQEYFQFGVRHAPPTNASEAGRIDVVRGASSILYGSDALGGAINVQTKDVPTAAPGSLAVGGDVGTAYYTNNNERMGRLSLRAARGPVGVRVGGERRVGGNYTTPQATTFFDDPGGATPGPYRDPKYVGEVPFTNFEQWTGYAQVGYDSPIGQLQLYGDYWGNQQNFLLPPGGADTPVGLGQNLEHGNLMASGTLTAGTLVVKPRLSVQRSVRQSAGPGVTLGDIEADGGRGDFDYPIDLVSTIYTGRVEAVHPSVYGLSGTLGLEVRYQDTNSRSSGPNAVELQPSADTWGAGLFAFEEYTSGPWTLTAGVRGDVRSVSVAPNARTRDPDALETTYTTLTAALGAYRALADGVALAANLGTGFRAPTVFERFADGVHGGVAAFQQGTPGLAPERSYSADLSLRVRRDRLTAEVAGYVNVIRNYVYLENTGDERAVGGQTLPIFRSAQTEAVLPGVDARVEGQLRSWLHVGGQTAVLGGQGEGLGTGGEQGRLPLLPANTARGFVHLTPAGVGVLNDPRLEVTATHVFAKDAAGRFEPFAQFDDRPFGTASTRAYTRLDASVSGTLGLGMGAPLSVRLDVRNVLDTSYRDFLDTYKGYALSPGRDVRLSLSTTF